jgi:hypothetical protein
VAPKIPLATRALSGIFPSDLPLSFRIDRTGGHSTARIDRVLPANDLFLLFTLLGCVWEGFPLRACIEHRP